jgi:hypothetical protein
MRLMLEDISEGTPRSGALKGQVCCAQEDQPPLIRS